MQSGRVAGAAEVTEPDPMGRVWTVPNLISLARLAGVPVFLWLVLGPRSAAGDWWAVGLLIAAGASDWLDGKIARALGQTSRLGQLLDPAADRLYIVATIIALAVRAIIPWWLVIALAVREVLMAVVLLVLRRHGWGSLQVSFVGKARFRCSSWLRTRPVTPRRRGWPVGPSRSGEVHCTGAPPSCTSCRRCG